MKAQDFINGIKAGYGFFYIQTSESKRCLDSLTQMVQEANQGNGLLLSLTSNTIWDFEKNPDPEAALDMVDQSEPWSVCILKNYHWFLQDKQNGALNYSAVQRLLNREQDFCSEENRRVVVMIGNDPFSTAIPKPLEKMFLSLDFGLPQKEEILAELEFVIQSAKGNPNFKEPTEPEKSGIVDSLKGLTLAEVTQALSFSLVKNNGRFDCQTLSDIRDKGLEKIAGIKVIDTDKVDPESIRGMDNLKDFVLRAINGKNRDMMKGVMLLGPPGTGKTTFFMWLSKVTGLRLYMVEVAELFGSLVGESEKLMRQLLEVLPMLAPGIVVIDEIEKALSGARGGSTDGGTTQRSLAQLLKFMGGERPSRLHVFATCNDISALPPEWVRAGRWDIGAVFIDLPSDDEKESILEYYKGKYSVKGKPSSMEGWSGAEIEACCRAAALLDTDLKGAEHLVCPVSKTMDREIKALREWAKGRTIPASSKIVSGEKKVLKRAIRT